MRLARRMAQTGESATMAVARRAQQMSALGIRLVDLGAGEPHFESPAVAIDAAQRALSEGHTHYTVLDGVEQLRTAIADRFAKVGAPWTGRGDALVTVGAKAALFELAIALFDQGDEVIIPTPCWVSLPEQVRLAGAKPILVRTVFERAFELDGERLSGAMTDRTRAVLINSPCNPTGGVIDADSLRRLAESCREHDALLIADETYERFLYDGRSHASVAELARDFPETVVLVGSFSKSYAMTGWRVGYVLGPRAVISAARSVQSHATSNATSFAQYGALAALGEDDLVESRVAHCERNRNLLVEGLNRIPGMRCLPPRGAFYAFPDVSGCFDRARSNGTAIAEQLLEEAGVVVVPGSAFGDDRYIRLSFATEPEILREGLGRMVDVFGA